MNDQQSAGVLGILTAAWPNQSMPDPTIDLWLGLLAEIDLVDATTAARTVVREDQWFPSVARFLHAVQAAKHARLNREAAHRGLPDGHHSSEPPAELVEASRRLIAAREATRHDHRGPDPCPVCGGVRAPTVDEKPTRDYVQPEPYGSHPVPTPDGTGRLATYAEVYPDDPKETP